MVVTQVDPWWRRKDHRGVRGARGARIASLRFHTVFLFSVVGFVMYLIYCPPEDMAIRIPPPPVPPPPPLERSLSYSMTREMPHLLSLELERKIPEHVPQQYSIDYNSMHSKSS